MTDAPRDVPEGDSAVECCTCCGNGEIVTDWERYKHPRAGDVGDEAVSGCPDCFGQGTRAPSETKGGGDGQ